MEIKRRSFPVVEGGLRAEVLSHPVWKLWISKLALVLADVGAFWLVKLVLQQSGSTKLVSGPAGADWLATLVLSQWPVYCAGLFWIWFVYRDYTYRKPLVDQYRYLVKLFFVMAMVDLATLALMHAEFSRTEWALVWIVGFVAVPVFRGLVRIVLSRFNIWQWTSIIIGSGSNAREAYFALKQDRSMGYEVRAFFAPDNKSNRSPVVGIPLIFERKEDYLPLCQNAHFFIALEYEQTELRDNLVRYLSQIGCRNVVVIPALRGVPLIGTDIMHVFSHEVLMMRLHNNLALLSSRFLKRVIDISLASIALIALSPAMAFLAYKISRDGGSAIYGHERVGQNGKRFRCLKFRSMVNNANEVLAQLLASDPAAKAEWDKDFKLRNDPRVTRIGQFIRKTSLDELPQLWNVLKGEMSLVGPRPVIQEELERYGDDKDYYLMAKPGVTGLWQVSGRNDTDYGTRIYLDSWYVKNWSVWYDLIIMCKTFAVVLRRDGAY